jgi:DNA-binding MarR family transcriptional regulator
METYEQLKLDNQFCFPFYAISRLITRQYQPFLDELGITYPQYLVLLVLWENDNLSVNQIAHRLILNTNTITPLLKRMETMKLLTRKKDKSDERKVIIKLTAMGSSLREKAKCIPSKLIESEDTNERQIEMMKKFQHQLLTFLNAMREEI